MKGCGGEGGSEALKVDEESLLGFQWNL